MTKMDINLGDLRYSIPAGKSRDLLAAGARLKIEDIDASRKSGSIALKLRQKLLVEIPDNLPKIAKNPIIKMVDKSIQKPIVFPQRTKSFITIKIGDIRDEALLESTAEDDADVLRQLELEGIDGTTTTPIVVKADVKTEK